MAVATLAMEGVFKARYFAIDPVAIPATAGINPHMMTVGTVIDCHQMFLMMKNNLALLILHPDSFLLIGGINDCCSDHHPDNQQ
jgi:hypothetical protein